MRDEFAGRHILVDAKVGDAAPLRDADRLSALFVRLADKLRMEIIDGPRVKEVPEDETAVGTDRRTDAFRDSGGLSAYAIISTSHLAIHTWPLEHYFSADIYSCKDFDADRALQMLREELDVTDWRVTEVVRRKP